MSGDVYYQEGVDGENDITLTDNSNGKLLFKVTWEFVFPKYNALPKLIFLIGILAIISVAGTLGWWYYADNDM